MSIHFSDNKRMLFLVIVFIALPGMGLWTELPIAMDLPAGYTLSSSTCDSETPIILTPISHISDLTNDRRFLYGLTDGDPGAVVKISKRNGNLQVLAEQGPGLASELLVDNKSVFWVEHIWEQDYSYTIKKVDKLGRKVTELWQAPGWMRYLTMDRHNLYWLDYEADAGMRISKKDGEPEVLVSGLNGVGNFAFVNGKVFLGGYEGLGVLEPGQMPRILITSKQLLRDLHLGLRDKWSWYYAGPVIGEYDDEIIFVFTVANYPGVGSCADNKDHIVALPESGGTPRILLTVSGSLGTGSLEDADLIPPYLYSVGRCQGGQVTNLDTGNTSTLDIGRDVSNFTVDKNYLYWDNSYSEGLKCMRRPTE